MKNFLSQRIRFINNARQPVQITRYDTTSFRNINNTQLRGLLHLLQLNSRPSYNNKGTHTATRLFNRQRLMIKLRQGNRIKGRSTYKRIGRIRTINLRGLDRFSNLIGIPATYNPINNKSTRRRQRNIKRSKAGHVRSFSRRTSTVIRQSTMLIIALISRQIRRLQRRMTIHNVSFRHIRTSIRNAPNNITRLIRSNISLVSTRHTQADRKAMYINT